MCELIDSTKRLASRRGLDPRQVMCPPDKRVLCTGAGCVLLRMLESKTEISPTKQVDKFYTRAEKSLRLIRERG